MRDEPPLLVSRPWLMIGVSKSAWFRMRQNGVAPRPVKLHGAGVKYRRKDLIEFVDNLPYDDQAGDDAAAEDGDE